MLKFVQLEQSSVWKKHKGVNNMATNIIIAGVGGQGLILATKIIAEAADAAGIDVKTNDVIGMSQRGGKVWGSVKLGEKVFSPNVNQGEADLLIAFELLEAKRFRKWLKKGDSAVVVNSYEMAPTLVQQEKEEYDPDALESLKEYTEEIISIDATQAAQEVGSPKMANVVMLGLAARYIKDIPEDVWVETIKKNVSEKLADLNEQAFRKAFRGEL